MASATFSSEDSDLIASLHALSAAKSKLVRSSLYKAPADPAIEIRSWKMNEFKYYDIPSPFPTLARGLFTREVQDEGQGKKYQIVVRGYDKFFNIGEVPWTTWASLEEHTAAPYTLSLKSNGCIIFIAALTPTKLLITSKHSLGKIENAKVSHAEAGELWLHKYLDKIGKTEEDLAKELWEKNWTAIAELCDDSFEEHVLGYPPEKTGLHLHGLNVRTKAFQTMPTDTVDAFADKWGFIKTPTKVVNSIKEVRDFTDACAQLGEWNGEPVEGFVVRTHVTEPPVGKSNDRSRSPYKPGSTFFFKVKFDEPYMMYRDWREVTKSLLSSKGPMKASNLPKSKMKRAETKVYVKWVINEIGTNPAAFKDFNKGKGIIATREKFLKWLKSEQGEQDLEEVKKEESTDVSKTTGDHKFGKTIIVPVAIPGCGKTVVSVALSNLFGFGHIQSDDIHVKKPAPQFIKNVVAVLKNNDVVIADKNNHLRQHREQLREATKSFDPPVRLIALNWSLDQPPATVHRICGDRVLGRGDNHQSLRADTSSTKSHEEVIWMFINTTEELAPSEVDSVIEMKLEENLDEAVERAAKGVGKILGLEVPTEEKIREALRAIEDYVPTTKRRDEPKKKKPESARYYGLLPEVDLRELLDVRLAQEDVDEETKAAWKALKEEFRVAKRPHVTIVHRNSINTEKPLWDRCEALHVMTATPPTFKGRLARVLWNGRVMALALEDFEVDEVGASTNQEGPEFVSKLATEIKGRLHITVGTKSSDILAVEAKGMVQAWNRGSKEGVKRYELKDVVVRGRIKALMS